MTYNQKQLGFLLSLGCLSLILSACSNNNQASTNNSVSSNSDQDKIASNQTATQNLVIDGTRCRGCGKCARIDSEHFTINQETKKAQVISADNLSSEKLSLAISMCHDRAISL